MVRAPHPESVIHTESRREVQLKVHQCVWSGEYPGNSLAAVRECYQAQVARAEIDLAILRDQDFLIVHELDLARCTDGVGRADETTAAAAMRLRLRHADRVTDVRPAVLSEVAAAIAAEPYPTLLELDLKDRAPWPWPRVEELAGMLQPIKARITFGGGAEANLRRLHHVDPALRLGFTPPDYHDWPADEQTPAGARERFSAIPRRVPAARDIHVRLAAAERLVRDGMTDLADLLHGQGMLLDLWTLNAGTRDWRSRLAGALAMGADVITTETPHALAAAGRSA